MPAQARFNNDYNQLMRAGANYPAAFSLQAGTLTLWARRQLLL